jgi:hypothetical protein
MSKPELNEHIEKILRKSNYVIKESPIYRPVMDNEHFDPMPDMKEAAPNDKPEAQGKPAPDAVAPTPPTPDPAASTAPAGSNLPSPPTPSDSSAGAPPAPSAPAAGGSTPPPMPTPSAPPMPEPQAAAPMEPMQPTKEELQKQAMELQLDAMKKMASKIDQLEGLVTSLNSQLADFSEEVDKVKDPSDVEKFNERKVDSSPYYFNLNDLWNNNTFQARMDTMNTKGIVKSKDGGYQADFDTMPKMNQFQVKDSFDAV